MNARLRTAVAVAFAGQAWHTMSPKGSFVLAVVSPVAAMLVIDSSGRMRDNHPRGARGEEVVRFLASAPSNAYIGLMEFSSSGGRLLAPVFQDFASSRKAASVISLLARARGC